MKGKRRKKSKDRKEQGGQKPRDFNMRYTRKDLKSSGIGSLYEK